MDRHRVSRQRPHRLTRHRARATISRRLTRRSRTWNKVASSTLSCRLIFHRVTSALVLSLYFCAAIRVVCAASMPHFVRPDSQSEPDGESPESQRRPAPREEEGSSDARREKRGAKRKSPSTVCHPLPLVGTRCTATFEDGLRGAVVVGIQADAPRVLLEFDEPERSKGDKDWALPIGKLRELDG